MLNSRFPYFLFATIVGGTFMAYELICANYLQPWAGSSFSIWITVLICSTGGLATGYFLSGFCHQKNHKQVIILTSILNLLLIGFSKTIFDLLCDFSFEWSIRSSSFLICFILLFIPGVLSGLVTPIMINSINTSEAGQISGKMYGLSTLSGLLYILITGFLLIPEISYEKTLFILLLPMIIAATLICFTYNKKIIAAIFPCLLCTIFLLQKNEGHRRNEYYSSHSIHGSLKVIEMKSTSNESRLMLVNGMGQTWMNTTNNASEWSYVNFLTAVSGLVKSEPEVLIVGLGGGIVANQIKQMTNASIDAIEIDKRIASCAKRFFNLDSTVHIIIDDGRHYLNACKKKYDLIIFDVFSGDVAPSHLLSKECFELTQGLLNEKGILAINFNGFEKLPEGKSSRILFKTLIESGYKTRIITTYEEERNRNTIFIASNDQLNLNNSTINITIKGNSYSIGNFEALPLRWFTSLPIITDDRPVMELYNFNAAEIWRRDFRNTLRNNGLNY